MESLESQPTTTATVCQQKNHLAFNWNKTLFLSQPFIVMLRKFFAKFSLMFRLFLGSLKYIESLFKANRNTFRRIEGLKIQHELWKVQFENFLKLSRFEGGNFFAITIWNYDALLSAIILVNQRIRPNDAFQTIGNNHFSCSFWTVKEQFM